MTELLSKVAQDPVSILDYTGGHLSVPCLRIDKVSPTPKPNYKSTIVSTAAQFNLS